MDKKLFVDPNHEVETWKDLVYLKHKELTGEELTKYFTEKTQNIIKKYKIKTAKISNIHLFTHSFAHNITR